MPSNQPKLVQLDSWPLTRDRVKHILEGLVKNGINVEVWITEAKPWILQRSWAPEGKWCKQFPSFRLAGEGSELKTGLGPQSACEGDWVS
jgi:hypothetical protein